MPDQTTGSHQGRSGSGRRSLAVWIWSSLLITDAVLVTRRFSGGFNSAIPDWLACSTTLLVAVVSWGAWFLLTGGRADHSLPHHRRWIAPAISVGVTLIWAWSISMGSTPLTCGVLTAIVILHTMAVAMDEQEWVRHFDEFRATHDRPMTSTVATSTVTSSLVNSESAVTGEIVVAETAGDEASVGRALSEETDRIQGPLRSEDFLVEDQDRDIESVEDSDENQTLWLSRRLSEEGEQIEGWVRVPFARGQRETVVHVAFCPPLPSAPEIETEDLEGVGLEIRVAAVFPFGARLSVRRTSRLEESNTDRVGFIAHSQPINRAA